MQFDWDEAKRAENMRKHQVDFTCAPDFVFFHARIMFQNRQNEMRRQAVSVLGARIHVMVYVIRAGRLRLISLRKANRRETRRYLSEHRHYS